MPIVPTQKISKHFKTNSEAHSTIKKDQHYGKIQQLTKPVFFGQESLSEFYRILKVLKTSSIEQLKKYLKGKKRSINKLDSEGWNCLHRAIISDDLPIIKLLVEVAKSDVNQSTQDPDPENRSYTPLDLAIKFGKQSLKGPIICYLIEKGATQISDKTGYSLLHAAVIWGTAEHVRDLVKNEADMDYKSKLGITPLDLVKNCDVPEKSMKLRHLTLARIRRIQSATPQKVVKTIQEEAQRTFKYTETTSKIGNSARRRP
jgi:hypothetical protein